MTTLNDKITALMAAGIDHATIVAAILADETPIPTDAMSHKASEPTNTTTNKEVAPVTVKYIDDKSISRAIAHRAAGERIPQWFLAGQTDATLKAMLRADVGAEWGHRNGTTIRKVAKGTARKLNRAQVTPTPAPAPSSPIRTGSNGDEPIAEQVCALLEAAPKQVFTAADVAEELGLTVRQARTALNVLTNGNRPSPRHGRIERIADNVYVGTNAR